MAPGKEPPGVFFARMLLGLVFVLATIVFCLALFGGAKEGGGVAMAGAALFVVLSAGFLLVSYTIEWLIRDRAADRRAENRSATGDAERAAAKGDG